ncbi:hypothetical protein BDN72DRAFT_496200 [Pluteus cervinus]|uniref:Uncharacterized protein n=1 Tax=Pluteus cervinus TaxID=181527 RepID=A0ACD3AZ30_9AGAR|nr:hypothetical protein BDN72DRAFT_496200 [Pluteus cervinus]
MPWSRYVHYCDDGTIPSTYHAVKWSRIIHSRHPRVVFVGPTEEISARMMDLQVKFGSVRSTIHPTSAERGCRVFGLLSCLECVALVLVSGIYGPSSMAEP